MDTQTEKSNVGWLSRSVLLISLSACFADLGYQAVLAMFPLFLVNGLHAPVWLFSIVMAVSFGPGAIFGLWGGRLGDRIGHKKVAITGNACIPLLSLSGLVSIPLAAAGLFCGGWWGRNFRSPPRRAMLTEVTTRENRTKAFGLLHALDIGGGFLAALGTVLLLTAGFNFFTIFLLTLIPLILSTFTLVLVRAGARRPVKNNPPSKVDPSTVSDPQRKLYRRILLATGLYGFSSFSFGFPILTVYQRYHSDAAAIGSYVVFFGISAMTGLLIGRLAKREVGFLAWGGYLIGGVASILMAVIAATHQNPSLFFPAVALMGFSLGVIETLEPAIMSLIRSAEKTGGGMGALTATRSLGLFAANAMMGILHHFGHGWLWAYGYVGLLGIAAALVLGTVGAQNRLSAQ
ncbi:MAG: MFS transporter [Phycisphaerae bacterium]